MSQKKTILHVTDVIGNKKKKKHAHKKPRENHIAFV